MSSKLVGCCHKDDKEQSDVIIVKLSTKGTKFVPNDDAELQIVTTLNAAGYFPPVYASFNNGFTYGFVPGESLNIQSVREDKMIRYIEYPYSFPSK